MHRTEDELGLRKAAVLLASLDPAASAQLLDELDSDTATAIRRTASELAEVAPEECERVLAEFLQGAPTIPESAGVEVDDSLARCLAQNADDAAVEQAASAPTYLPWRSLTSQTLGNCLRNEHPQVIAVVLTQLPPTQAAGVLAVLPAALQTDVLQRITRAPHPAPELLGDIVEVIEARLPWIEGLQATPAEGISTAKAILDAADDQSRRRWLSGLSQPSHAVGGGACEEPDAGAAASDEHLPARSQRAGERGLDFAPGHGIAAATSRDEAATARDSLATHHRENASRESSDGGPATIGQLEDLLRWDDEQLAKLFRITDPLIVVLALAGAAPDVARQLEARLAPRESRVLARHLTRLGPWRLNDAAHATRQLLQIASACVTTREG